MDQRIYKCLQRCDVLSHLSNQRQSMTVMPSPSSDHKHRALEVRQRIVHILRLVQACLRSRGNVSLSNHTLVNMQQHNKDQRRCEHRRHFLPACMGIICWFRKSFLERNQWNLKPDNNPTQSLSEEQFCWLTEIIFNSLQKLGCGKKGQRIEKYKTWVCKMVGVRAKEREMFCVKDFPNPNYFHLLFCLLNVRKWHLKCAVWRYRDLTGVLIMIWSCLYMQRIFW